MQTQASPKPRIIGALVLWLALFGLACQHQAPTAGLQELDGFLSLHPPAELTGRALPAGDVEGLARVLVFGHAYGSPGRARDGSPLPAPSLVAATYRLSARDPHLALSMGDFVFRYRLENITATTEVFGRLGAPVLNAVGNH
jgi:hypothetical protein